MAAAQRTRGARGGNDQMAPWDGVPWTFAVVGRVWPSSERILPEASLLALSQFQQRRMVEVFENHEDKAFECVRWARWLTKTGNLHVLCIKCARHAWSYGAVTKWNHKQKRYRPIIGNRRWRCLTAAAHRANLDVKDRGSACRVRTGCGAQFCDTSGTPLLQSRLPIGLVLAAAYYSSATVEQLLVQCGKKSKAIELRTLVQQLQKQTDRTIWKRLRRYSRLFCGYILLHECPDIRVRSGGKQLVVGNWKREAARQLHLASVQQNAKQRLRKRYQQVETVLRQLEQVDQSRLQGQVIHSDRRRELVRQLTAVTRKVKHALSDRAPLAA